MAYALSSLVERRGRLDMVSVDHIKPREPSLMSTGAQIRKSLHIRVGLPGQNIIQQTSESVLKITFIYLLSALLN